MQGTAPFMAAAKDLKPIQRKQLLDSYRERFLIDANLDNY